MFLRQVTLREVEAWLKKNPHVTWGANSWGKAEDKAGSRKGKYIQFRLDTRMMTVFRIELMGVGEPIVVDFRDGKEGSLLDELDRRLTEDGK